jgi:hypothetical protein
MNTNPFIKALKTKDLRKPFGRLCGSFNALLLAITSPGR